MNEIDRAWFALAEERYQAWKDGREPGIPMEEAFEGIRAELGWNLK
ncbi:MAG: hypothetical protein Q7P63_01480 [Verrucomicrobiota bacterium JB022]|nr:hypothetical protein [Verrucomicrobiota bacterium JB022]